MRLIQCTILVLFLSETVFAQPVRSLDGLGPEIKATMTVKLEAVGKLHVRDQIDTDAQVLVDYSRYTGLEMYAVSPGVTMPFELFFGDHRDLLERAKKMKGNWAIVEGDLAVVHGPMRLIFGDFSGPLGRTQNTLAAKPRYVIKVRRLEAAPAPEPNKELLARIRFKVQGVLQTNGKNPAIADLYSKTAYPESIIRSDPCDYLLYLGKDDDWLPRAKELNGKPASIEGDLKWVGATVGTGPGAIKPGFYFLNVTNLHPAKPVDVKPEKK